MDSQEVRRFYPFTPFIGAKVRKNFAWKGYFFKKGTLILLDIYGINHDPRLWDNPYKFQPERFDNMDISSYNFLQQGGGSVEFGHRCPGEKVTVELMKVSLDFIVNNIHFTLPEQNFTYSLSRIPSLPKSGMIIKNPLLISYCSEVSLN